MKCESLNFHITLFELLEDELGLSLTLPILYRILVQKTSSTVFQDFVILGLPKFKKHLIISNTDILSDIIQILSIVARTDGNYYPPLSSLSLI